MTETGRLYEKLGCFGYCGFADGYVVSSAFSEDLANGTKPEQLQAKRDYCSQCPLHKKCWEAHKDRVRAVFPELCAYVDSWPERGIEFTKRHQREFGMVDPYLAAFGGNLQDGAAVACGMAPKDRRAATLTWPLKPIARERA